MRILSCYRDHFLIEESVYFFRMCSRVDAAVDQLTFSHQIILARLNFLDLGNEVTGFPYFFIGLCDNAAGSLI